MRLLALPLLFVFLTVPIRAQQDLAVAGVNLTLPQNWKGPVESDESHAPQWLSYTLYNGNAESDLNGARLIVYRVAGLDRLERNAWWRGRLPFGYGGLRPVAAVTPAEMVFQNARGYRTEGAGQRGNIYLTQHGQAFYAFHLSLPAEDFDAKLPALLEIARTVRFL